MIDEHPPITRFDDVWLLSLDAHARGARGALDRLVDDGQLVRGEVAGRNAHYVLRL